MTARSWLAAWPAALLIALPAHAGLFDDTEARRAILDLRAKFDAMDAQQKKSNAELAAQNAALAEQVAALRRSLLELNTTLELMRGEMAKMRGQDEQIARDVAELQRKAKDIATGVDDRIRRLEPEKVVLDGAEFLAEADEKRQFDEAFEAFRASDFDKAIAGFGVLNRRWPTSGYREAALFWLLPGARRRVAHAPEGARGAARDRQLPGRAEGPARRTPHARRTCQGLPAERGCAGRQGAPGHAARLTGLPDMAA